MNNDLLLFVEIKETKLFQHIIKQIGNVIDQCCFNFINETSNNNKNGISVQTLSKNKTEAIIFTLHASNFESFFCSKNKLQICLNLGSFCNGIKSCHKSTKLHIKKNDPEWLHIESSSTSYSFSTAIKCSMTNKKISIPKMEFDNKIIFKSSALHNICNCLMEISNSVKIQVIDNKIIFESENDDVKLSLTHFIKNFAGKNHCDIGNNFHIKNIEIFSESYNKNDQIYVYLKNEFPLVMELPIAPLGKMYFMMSPIVQEEINKINIKKEIVTNSNEQISISI